MRNILAYLLIIVIMITACNSDDKAAGSDEETAGMTIVSPVFVHEGRIPAKYTCDGEDISPALKWEPVEGAVSYALIADDPDAPVGGWVHWVIFNIPSEVTELPENIPDDAVLENGAVQGKNSWPKIGYGGPCPPSGTHHYYFKIYALDAMLDLDSSAVKADVLKAMQGHILAQGELMGTYSRH